jgi:hypothetical protein
MKLVLNDLWAVSRGAAFALKDAPASCHQEPSPPIFTNPHEAEQEARHRAEAPGDTPFPEGEWMAVPLGQLIDWALAAHVEEALREVIADPQMTASGRQRR